MARISGVDIPREKRLEISLTYIFGIGLTMSQEICARTDVDPNTRVRDLTDEEITRLRFLQRTGSRVGSLLRFARYPSMWLLPLRPRFRLCPWLQSRQSESVTLNACEHTAEDEAMKRQHGVPVH